MEVKSYFSTKTPLYTINYDMPNMHEIYVYGRSNDVFMQSMKTRYKKAVEEWLNTPFISDCQRFQDYDEDNEYYEEENEYYEEDNQYYDEEDEYTNKRDYDTTHNRDVIRSIYEDVVETVYNNGYEISNMNLFKEDLIYLLYRLSRV